MLYFQSVKVNEMVADTTWGSMRSQICVIFPGALGDFVCFLPTLKALAVDNDVDLFARKEFADLVPPGVCVRSLERYEITQCFVAGSQRDERVSEFFGSYGAIYSWHGNGQPDFVRSLAAASRNRAQVFPFRPSGNHIHQIDYYLSCIGVKEARSTPKICLRPEAIAWNEEYRQRHNINGKPLLVLAPGSGAREKHWPQEYFRAVAQWWRDTIPGNVIVLFGPVEEEHSEMAEAFSSFVIARNLNLGQIASLLASADVYLGNDSGVTHVAAAVGTRTIALFGPSDARQWASRGENVTILTENTQCSPCGPNVMKSCPHRQCLNTLNPKKVIAVLRLQTTIANLTRGVAGITVCCEIS